MRGEDDAAMPPKIKDGTILKETLVEKKRRSLVEGKGGEKKKKTPRDQAVHGRALSKEYN